MYIPRRSPRASAFPVSQPENGEFDKQKKNINKTNMRNTDGQEPFFFRERERDADYPRF